MLFHIGTADVAAIFVLFSDIRMKLVELHFIDTLILLETLNVSFDQQKKAHVQPPYSLKLFHPAGLPQTFVTKLES